MKKTRSLYRRRVSAESGLATFRDSDGTWGITRSREVCIPEALDFNRRGVIRFYNDRRREMPPPNPIPHTWLSPLWSAISTCRSSPRMSITCTNGPVRRTYPPSRRAHQTAFVGRSVARRAVRRHRAGVRRHGSRRLAAASAHRLLRRARPRVRARFGACRRGRYFRGDRYVAGGLSRCVAGAVRASRNSGLCGRSGPPGDPGHPQSAGGDPQMRRRGRSGVGRSSARNLCGTSCTRKTPLPSAYENPAPRCREADFRPMAGRRTIPASRPCL